MKRLNGDWCCWCLAWWMVRLVASEAGCDGQQLALYKVVFQTDWTEARFPKHYPKWRPHAQWSTLVGRSHSSSYRLWKLGGTSSDGVKQLAETGQTELLVGHQGNQGIFDEFYGAPVPQGAGTTEANFMVDSNHTKVSLMSRIVPSPDWFVGVDSLELCRKTEGSKQWLRNLAVDSEPMDAGTDNGFTFTSPNWDTEPRARVSRITSQHPSHPANSFYYPNWKKLPRLAQFKFTLIKVFDLKVNKDVDEVQEPVVNTIDNRFHQRRPQKDHQGLSQLQPVVTEVHFVKQEDNQDLKKLLVQKDAREEPTELSEVPPIGEKEYDDHVTNQIDSGRSEFKKKFRRKIKRRSRPCRVSEWSEWSHCSKTCGFGESFRTKRVIKHPQPGGQPCPPIRESRWCGGTRNCRSLTGYFVW